MEGRDHFRVILYMCRFDIPVVSVPGSFQSRFISVSGRFGPWSFQSQVVLNWVISTHSHFGLGLFQSRVFSVPGHFSLGLFRSQVVSVTGHFRPESFRFRVIQPQFVSRVVSAPGHFGPGSFELISVPGRSVSVRGVFRSHVILVQIISVSGRFGRGHFRPCRFGLGSWLYMCLHLLSYFYM